MLSQLNSAQKCNYDVPDGLPYYLYTTCRSTRIYQLNVQVSNIQILLCDTLIIGMSAYFTKKHTFVINFKHFLKYSIELKYR